MREKKRADESKENTPISFFRFEKYDDAEPEHFFADHTICSAILWLTSDGISLTS